MLTSGSADLDVKGSDAELLAAEGNVLGSQHGGVRRGLVAIGLDLHAAGDTAESFATTGITQCQPQNPMYSVAMGPAVGPLGRCCSRWYEPEIGDTAPC